MHRNYTLSHPVMACLLLLSFWLQSCTNFSNAPISKIEESRNNIQKLPNLITIKYLGDQNFRASGDNLVTFYQEDGKLQADLRVDAKQKEANYKNLPVRIAKGIDLDQLFGLSLKDQEKVIHFNAPKNGHSGCVFVCREGLAGGGNNNVKGAKNKKGEKEKARREKGNKSDERLVTVTKQNLSIEEALGAFEAFPVEILQMILSYVLFPYILDIIKVNHTFYELITGYSKVGLIGVENRPNSVFHCNSWLSDKQINFKSN